MHTHAQQLALHFARANAELAAVAWQCPESQWQSPRDAEGWTTGVTVGHIAADYLDLLALIEAIAEGRRMPAMTRKDIDERNARHAEMFASYSKEETLALLERNAATVTRRIESLRDEQLECTGVMLGRRTTIEQIITVLLPGHIESHLASIRAAM